MVKMMKIMNLNDVRASRLKSGMKFHSLPSIKEMPMTSGRKKNKVRMIVENMIEKIDSPLEMRAFFSGNSGN